MEFLAAVLRADGKQMLSLGGEWPRVESLCRDHQLLGNAFSDGWFAAAILARQLVLLEG